jgi:predicted DCC family thiol-disulfide oxidoreductase YuxK
MVANADVTTPVLVFDGDCGFCSTTVRWLEKRLGASITAVPYQWTDLTVYNLSEVDASRKVWLVTRGGALGGHEAVAALFQLFPARGWQFLGQLMLFPLFVPFARAGYWLVARYRHRLPGGTPACKLPPRN